MKKRFTLTARHSLFGYVFIMPWVIGALAFFILPLIEAARVYMFYSVRIIPGGIEAIYIGLENIRRVFIDDPENVRLILTSLGVTLSDAVLIIVFSLTIALLLNKRFPTQTFARMLYMLPVIMTSGIIIKIFKQDLFAESAIAGSDRAIFQSIALRGALYSLGLPINIVFRLTDMVNQILEITWRSGVQILLFFTALKSIPSSYYEVCKVEGATGWQTFWSITFPMLSPFLTLFSIYTVIDSFMFIDNQVMLKIKFYFNLSAFELNTILAVFYSLGVLAVSLIIWLVTSRIAHKNTAEA